MTNPWLDIPLSDYEAHMASPGIGQAQMLAERFDGLIERLAPASVALMGCAGGNGLERLLGRRLKRAVGVDINPAYLEAAATRYAGRLPGLELLCADVQSAQLRFEPVDLLYAGLLFEYVEAPAALATMRRNCRPGGALATLLQLPSAHTAAVTPSRYSSLRLLEPLIRLLDPLHLDRMAAAAGFALSTSEVIELASGKKFCLQIFHLTRGAD